MPARLINPLSKLPSIVGWRRFIVVLVALGLTTLSVAYSWISASEFGMIFMSLGLGHVTGDTVEKAVQAKADAKAKTDAASFGGPSAPSNVEGSH